MRYCLARHEEKQQGKAYRVYVTDALQIVAENTARFAGGKHLERRYIDVITPKKEDTRTGEEIKEHMKAVLEKLA